MEIEGSTVSKLSNKKVDVDEDESEEPNDHVADPIKQAADDADEASKSLMSNRKRGLLEAMEVHVLILYASIHEIYWSPTAILPFLFGISLPVNRFRFIIG